MTLRPDSPDRYERILHAVGSAFDSLNAWPDDPHALATVADAVEQLIEKENRRQQALPEIQGRCPACRGESLFLGEGGYVTCSRIDCPDPDAATRLLEQRIDYTKIRVIGVGPETAEPPTSDVPAALRGPNWKAQP